MTVRIRTPSVNGDATQVLELQMAKKAVDQFVQKHWLVTVNRKLVQSAETLEDGDEVLAFPPIAGG